MSGNSDEAMEAMELSVLPDELLGEILAFVPLMRLFALTRVSSLFKRIVGGEKPSTSSTRPAVAFLISCSNRMVYQRIHTFAMQNLPPEVIFTQIPPPVIAEFADYDELDAFFTHPCVNHLTALFSLFVETKIASRRVTRPLTSKELERVAGKKKSDIDGEELEEVYNVGKGNITFGKDILFPTSVILRIFKNNPNLEMAVFYDSTSDDALLRLDALQQCPNIKLFYSEAYDFTEQKVYEFVEKMQSLQIISLPNYTRKKSWLLTGLGFEKTEAGGSIGVFHYDEEISWPMDDLWRKKIGWTLPHMPTPPPETPAEDADNRG